MNTGIVIIGKGLAAMVLSSQLKQKGIAHVLLERTTNAKTMELAETLPPSALPLLQSLGLLELFEEQSIRRTFGYHSLWATDQLTDNNFYFQHPFKYGLKIDKKKIIEQLAIQNGVPFIQYDHHLSIELNAFSIGINYSTDGVEQQLKAQLVVDATGRSRAVLKMLKVVSKNHDHCLSFTAHLPKKTHPDIKHDVLVESFAEGWGLVSGLNERTNVVSVFPDPNVGIAKHVGDYNDWAAILQNTKYLKHFLSPLDNVKVRGTQSNSSKPEKMAGPGWLAIGDAAMAFDPLCSHGVTNAIYTAKRASELIVEYLDSGEAAPLEQYTNELNEVFDAYLRTRNLRYEQKAAFHLRAASLV